MSRRPDQLGQSPIGLKQAMRDARISALQLCRVCADVRHQRLGNPISRTSLYYLARNGIWPAGFDADRLRLLIESAISAKGISTAGLWEPEAATSGSRPRKETTAPNPEQGGAAIYDNHIPEPEMLSEAARRHFGLFRHPFLDDVQGTQDVYLSRDARYVREAMYYAAKHGGFLAVVGESGAGKSVLRRDLVERLRRSEERIAVVQPQTTDKRHLSAHHICQAILADVSVERPKNSLEAIARQVQRALSESAQAGNGHVLLIEEAHDLNVSTLKYLKRFWEIEDGFKKLIGIILIGQTELGHVLDERRNPQAREVIRRCEIATLRPLGDDVRAYVEHKLKRVMDKGRSIETVFDSAALDAIRQRLLLTRQGSRTPEDHSFPLNVHNVVVRAMNSAVELGFATVTADLVREV